MPSTTQNKIVFKDKEYYEKKLKGLEELEKRLNTYSYKCKIQIDRLNEVIDNKKQTLIDTRHTFTCRRCCTCEMCTEITDDYYNE